MDSDTKLLVGRHESHEIEITSFEEASFELRRINQEIAKINERDMIKRKSRYVLLIVLVIIWIILEILEILN